MSGSAEGAGEDVRLPPRVRAPTRWAPWAVAAAIVLSAVIAAAVLLPLTGSEVVATASLEPLADVAAAHAELVIDDAERSLEIDTLHLPPIDGYYELWLMTREGDGLVSLGPVGTRVRAAVPAAIDIGRFSVVDISREPSDGNPAHSTDSVLRGQLRAQT
jgi:anti-sigma-K factor RskA